MLLSILDDSLTLFSIEFIIFFKLSGKKDFHLPLILDIIKLSIFSLNKGLVEESIGLTVFVELDDDDDEVELDPL